MNMKMFLIWERKAFVTHLCQNVKIDRLMKIRLIRTFPPHAFPYALLRTCGVKLIRGPVAIPEELQKRLDAFPEKAD